MQVRQAVIVEPFKVEVRRSSCPRRRRTRSWSRPRSAPSAPAPSWPSTPARISGCKDPNLPDWKFPFRSGYSAAGTVARGRRRASAAGSRATASAIPATTPRTNC